MDSLKKLLNQPSVRVVLVYIVFSAIWIVFTDWIVEQILTDPSTITQAQTIKGWLFVLASGGVLILVIKIAGRQLEINRDQYKTMLGDANIGIARLEKMKVVSSNPAFRNILGRDSRELAEHPLFVFVDEYIRVGFREAVESLEKQNTIQQELKVRLTRNKRRWVQINISKHKDQEGEYHQVILQDINDRKTYQAYTDLLLKVMLTLEPTDNFKAGLRGILNNLCMELNWEYGIAFTPGPDGEYQKQVSWYRLDPLFDEFDSKVESYRFKSGEGLIGLTAREKKSMWIENLETDQRFMHRNDAIDADLRSVASVPVVVSEEVIAVLILFSREPLDSDEELLKLLTAIGHDIGIKLEKRKQQDDKEKLENSLNFALQSASMATWDMDLESGNVIRSQNHHELFGFDRAPETWNVDDLTGNILEEDRENVNKQLYEAVFETKGFNAEFRIRKNGSIRWLWSRGDLQYDKYGEPERLSGVVTDITKRKQFQIYTEMLLQIFLSIEPLKDLQIAYENILKVICKKNIWQYGEIWQFNKESGKSECTKTWSHQDDELLKSFGNYSKGKIFEKGEGIPGSGKNSNELLWISDIRQDKRFVRRKKAAAAGLISAVSIPLGVDEEPVASILLFTKYQLVQDEDTVNFLNAIRNNLGMKLARKKAVERLEKTEKSLKYALNASGMAAWDVDLDTGVLTLSENYEAVLGLELGDKPVFDRSLSYVFDEDRKMLARHLEKAINGKGEIDIEYRIRNKQDEVRWLWSHGHYSQSDSGRPRISGIVRDVTEKKTIELELKRERELLELIYDTVPVMFTIYRPDLSGFRVNKEFERVTGWRNEDLDKIDLIKEVHPDEEYRKEVVEFINQPGKGWKEVDMKIRDGSTIHSTWTNIRLMDDTQIGIGLDITEQKKLRDQIESERQELLTIFNNMPVFINIHNVDSGIGEVNRFFEDRLGYTQKDIRDKNLLKLITTEEGYEEAQEHIKKADGTWKDFELTTKNGERLQSTWTNIQLSEAKSIGIGLDISERKKMEEKVEAERQRFEMAVDAVSDVVWDYNALKETLWWNEGIETVFGYDRQAILGRKQFWENHIYAEDREKTIKSIRESQNSDAFKWSASYRFLDANGGIREVEDTARIIRDEEGNLVRIIGAMVDVTELKNYQRELQEERTRFEAIATLTNDVIYDYDVASEHFWASEGIYSILGYDPGKYPVAIEWWKEYLYPEDRERIIESLDSALESGAKKWKVNYRFIGAGGAEKNIIENALIIRDEKNQPVRMLGAMIDATAEKKSERALRESEERYRRLFDQNPYPMWIYDPKTSEILQVNQAMILKYGYTEKEFKSIKIQDLSPPEEAARLKKELQVKPDGLRVYQGVTHLKKDGSKLIVDVTALAIRYKGDQQRLVVINDITRQKRAEEKIIGSVIEGSENERRRIAKELHDGLGQYLTAASMNLDSVYEELNSLPEVKWNQYEKGLRLLRNAIVESRRISQNLLPKAIEDFGLSLAVQSLVDDFSDSFDPEISYSDNLEDINLSESVELNIYRIIQEATNNAARHSGCSRIDIQLILDDHQLICTIEDNGRGFEYSSKKDQGMGLASIKNRVNALSGDMEISTRKGKGTLVSVIVPVKAV